MVVKMDGPYFDRDLSLVYLCITKGAPEFRCALVVDSLMGYVAILACVQRTLAQSRRLRSLDQRSGLSSC